MKGMLYRYIIDRTFAVTRDVLDRADSTCSERHRAWTKVRRTGGGGAEEEADDGRRPSSRSFLPPLLRDDCCLSVLLRRGRLDACLDAPRPRPVGGATSGSPSSSDSAAHEGFVGSFRDTTRGAGTSELFTEPYVEEEEEEEATVAGKSSSERTTGAEEEAEGGLSRSQLGSEGCPLIASRVWGDQLLC